MATLFDWVRQYEYGIRRSASAVADINVRFRNLFDNVIRPAWAQLSEYLKIRFTVRWYSQGFLYQEESYERFFYRAVIESCSQELGHDNQMRYLALRLLLPREYYLATLINEYLHKNELKPATNVICSLDTSDIRQIKQIYSSLYGRKLAADIETFTFGDHRKLLLEHIRVQHRKAGVGEERLKNIVKCLHEKVQETYKCPQLAIMNCVYELNEEDLRIAVDRYSTEYRKPLVEDLTLAGYGHFEHGLVTKIQCAMNRPKYYAEKLYKAFGAMRDPNIEGMIDADHHIDYETIVRVITTVAEREMMMMKEEYRKKSGRALENDISEAFVDRRDGLQLILMILNGGVPSLYQEYERIRKRATQNDGGLYYRAVIESRCEQYGDDYYGRDLELRQRLPHEAYLANLINKYLSKKDLTHATEEICSFDSSEIQEIKGLYPSLFGREFGDDIETGTVGEHRKLLLKHISVPHGNAGIGEERLKNTVRFLHKKVRETYKCPQLAIMDSIYELNEEDLRIVVDRYGTEYRKPLVEDLTRARYGHFEHGLVTKIRCAVNRPEFFAEKLYEAFGAMRDPNMQGMIDAQHHIDDETIVTVITTVAEEDMMMMKEEYRRKSGRFELEDDIYEAFADRKNCLDLIRRILNPNAPN